MSRPTCSSQNVPHKTLPRTGLARAVRGRNATRRLPAKTPTSSSTRPPKQGERSVAADNFGCGSPRAAGRGHDGLRHPCVISNSFASILLQQLLQEGGCRHIKEQDLEKLFDDAEPRPNATRVDRFETQEIRGRTAGVVKFELDPHASMPAPGSTSIGLNYGPAGQTTFGKRPRLRAHGCDPARAWCLRSSPTKAGRTYSGSLCTVLINRADRAAPQAIRRWATVEARLRLLDERRSAASCGNSGGLVRGLKLIAV